jgi:hypothetical protein
MVGYRCYILDADDHIVQAHDLECETDAQAGSTAEGLLARDPYNGSVEVWNATRRVVKLERTAAQRRPQTRGLPRSDRSFGSVRCHPRRVERSALTWAAATDTKFLATKN